jgi:hypothetical protein
MTTKRQLTEAEGILINNIVRRKINQVLLENRKEWGVLTKVKGKWEGSHWKANELESYLFSRATARAISFINRPESERTTQLENWLNKGMDWLVKDFYKHMKKQDVLNLGDSYTEKLSIRRESMDKKLKEGEEGSRTLHEATAVNNPLPNTDKSATDNSIIDMVDEILMLLEDKVSINKYEKYTIVLEGIAFTQKWQKKGHAMERTRTVKDNGTIHLEGLGKEILMNPRTIARLLKEIGKHLENDKDCLRKFAKNVRF